MWTLFLFILVFIVPLRLWIVSMEKEDAEKLADAYKYRNNIADKSGNLLAMENVKLNSRISFLESQIDSYENLMVRFYELADRYDSSENELFTQASDDIYSILHDF